MTTQLINVDFSPEVEAFRHPQSRIPTGAICTALADLLRSKARDLGSDVRVLALLHSVNKRVHGKQYMLDGAREQARLEKLFTSDALSTKKEAEPECSGKKYEKNKKDIRGRIGHLPGHGRRTGRTAA
jgi:hypothetical protein